MILRITISFIIKIGDKKVIIEIKILDPHSHLINVSFLRKEKRLYDKLVKPGALSSSERMIGSQRIWLSSHQGNSATPWCESAKWTSGLSWISQKTVHSKSDQVLYLVSLVQTADSVWVTSFSRVLFSPYLSSYIRP